MKQGETALDQWLEAVPGASALAAMADLNRSAAVFIVDARRNVVHWNAAAEAILGYRAHEVLGQHCLRVNRCAACVAACALADHGDVRDAQVALHAADGAVVHLRKDGRAFFDAAGNFVGGIEILTPDAAVQEEPPLTGTEAGDFHGMVSGSALLEEIFRTIRTVAPTDACTLIGGESGTGKELVARAIHAESTRAQEPFVAVNCGALVPTLVESELFGHVKGAFTGATADRDGVLLRADGGTLFLDEVAELSLEVQAKLLRVVERSCFVPVGGRQSICVDVRIVAATHRSLPRLVELGQFREDLMYRLRVVPITLPPLRERRGDIPRLVQRFVEMHNQRQQRSIERVSPDAMAALEAYHWPGNIRQLQNAITYAFAVGRDSVLRQRDLPAELREAPEAAPKAMSSAALGNPQPGGGDHSHQEAERIRAALAACGGHIGRAAEQLGMRRPTLWRKRRRLGIVN